MPGIATGRTALGEIEPALPKEVPNPGSRRSTMVTENPSRWRKAAELTPTMPAPMTVTCPLLPLISGPSSLWFPGTVYSAKR